MNPAADAGIVLTDTMSAWALDASSEVKSSHRVLLGRYRRPWHNGLLRPVGVCHRPTVTGAR